MFKLTTCKSYGRDEYLYETSWDDENLTLDKFLNKYRGEYRGTPNEVRIFNKRYGYQKDTFNSSDYDKLSDLNEAALRPCVIKDILAVGGWGPITFYIRLV